MFTNPPVHYNGIRFALNAKDSLVTWINTINNREFSSDDFEFNDPTEDGFDGWVMVTGKYLPSDEPITLRLQRVNLSSLKGLEVITLHSSSYDKPSISKALFDQYGIFLEPTLFELDVVKQDINNVIGSTLHGFDTGESPDIIEDSVYGDAEGIIHISSKHLTLEGSIAFKIRTALLSFDKQIDSILKLREFYTYSDESKPFVETIQPKGVWTVDKTHFGSMPVKKEIDARLYEITLSPDTVVDYAFLAQVLTDITGQQWNNDVSELPFNVMGSIIKYNGVAGKYPNIAPVTHSYLMILELSELCSNLQGDIHIAYQYANYAHPLYGNKTLAGTSPL